MQALRLLLLLPQFSARLQVHRDPTPEAALARALPSLLPTFSTPNLLSQAEVAVHAGLQQVGLGVLHCQFTGLGVRHLSDEGHEAQVRTPYVESGVVPQVWPVLHGLVERLVLSWEHVELAQEAGTRVLEVGI